MMTEAPAGESRADAPVTTAVDDANALPFVAPCRKLGTWEPIGWLRHAWCDFKTAPRQSLTYGAVVVLLSWALGLANEYAGISLGQQMTYDLAGDLFAKLQQLSLRFHTSKSVGDNIRRVTADNTWSWSLSTITRECPEKLASG